MHFRRFLTLSTLWLASAAAVRHFPAPELAAQETASSAAALDRPLPSITEREGQDWPQFLGPTVDGKSTERLTVKDKAPPVAWHVPVGEGYGACSVSGGRLYFCDRIENTSQVRCLNAETGAELWKFSYQTEYVDMYGYDGGPRCSPLIDGGRVYVYGVEGMLHCLRAEDGKMLWSSDTAKTFGVVQNFFGVGSNPVVEGDLLLAMVGGSPGVGGALGSESLANVKPNGSGVVAFDKRTGAVRYKSGDTLASYSSLKLATVKGRRLAFSFAREGLLGLAPQTGKIEFLFPWRAKILESVNASTPVVQGEQVLISETYGKGAALLRLETPGAPAVVWEDSPLTREKKLETHWNTPILHDGYLYACSGRHTGNAELRCVAWGDGAKKWGQGRLTRTSLTYADEKLLCLGEYGDLLVLRANPEKFDLLLQFPQPEDADGTPLLRYPCWAAPVLSRGLMYVRGAGRLVCFDWRR